MKHLLKVLMILCLSGCCNPKERYHQIEDKSWFRFNSDTIFKYESTSGLRDSLILSDIDTSLKEVGVECASITECRKGIFKSKLINDFQIEISLDYISLLLNVDYQGNSKYYLYCNSCSRSVSTVGKLDSISIKNIFYHDVLVLSDTLSRDKYKIYYNRDGLIRYILKLDTFNLKK
jgi:hypothetical protein